MVKNMAFTVGAPVEGNDFLNRVKEIKQVLESIKKDNILFISPRRFGKTSVMKETLRLIQNQHNICIYMDIGYFESPQQFVLELTNSFLEALDKKNRKSLMKKILSTIGKKASRVEEIEIFDFRIKLREALTKDWDEKGNAVIKKILREFSEENIFIAVDEIPECVKAIVKDNPKEALRFLRWLRSIRQKYRQIKFMFGGSISFDREVKRFNDTSVLNDLKRIKIGGFSKNDAVNMIETCFKKMDLKYRRGFAEEILNCIGEPYIPYFISVMLSIIETHAYEGLTEHKIREYYELRLLGTEGKGYFEQYKERLKKYPFEKSAREILKKISNTENYPLSSAYGIFRKVEGRDDEDYFNDLIVELENDFYIVRDNINISFYSKLLKDWWVSYYG